MIAAVIPATAVVDGSDEKLTAFMELQSAIRACGEVT
jgi:hypothetical protein